MGKILAIETSCDDLSVCIYENGQVLSLCTASQVQAHQPYGGIVPEIASREHLATISQTVTLALAQACCQMSELAAVAATYAPGLVGSILVGLNFAKALSLSLNIPLLGVHHIEAHLLSPCLEHSPQFPALGLVLSGGHTHLYQINSIEKYQLLGHTVDDAIGEAFDKVAKLMGLPYPGGPWIDKLSQKGNPKKFVFTHPQIKDHSLHVSYSGLKTAAQNYWKNLEPNEQNQADLAASFQHCAIAIIQKMIEQAVAKTHLQQILVSGGVACNSYLRNMLQVLMEQKGIRYFIPSPKYCTDNAAMVAYVAHYYLKQGYTSSYDIDAMANKNLTDGETAFANIKI